MAITGSNNDQAPLAMIAGGGGFLGSATAARFVAAGWRVTTLGLGAPHGALADNVSHHEGLLQRGLFSAAAEQDGAPDLIIHAAGGASVGRSWEDPRGDFELSVGSTVEILDFIREEAQGTHLVLVSSAAVYGDHAGGRLSETAPTRPVSPYGLHKQVCEQLAIGESRMTGLGVSIVRLFSIYGDGLRKQILWDILNRVTRAPDQAIELWGTGDETRDFLHVDDAAGLIQRLAETREPASARTFNGGTGLALSVRALAEQLIKAAGLNVPVTFNGKVRSGDPRDLVSDPERIVRGLGFAPTVSLEQGLKRYVDWFERGR